MKDFQEAISFIQMIEDGTLINPEQIHEIYQITQDDLETLVSNRQISYPEEKFGTEWYLDKEIELVSRYGKRED